ncbi:sulfotransferase family protein [Archangium sp. Cb G35]|uniref:sulfotransferase n=1 Tax=Archangium sp. Cb G35 TaxID=1920190 RepID=UPI0009368A95|nr:sulfotransferase [Archangium sp. Cb G35]OJT20818.1 sulfotransferase family protein [Archangium sp. Cb G35]
MSRHPLKVLYITGWCRNGSTIIGNVLNEVAGFFHTGELSFLWKNAYGNGSNTACGCGEALTRCGIWSRVLQEETPPGRSPAEHARDVARRQTEGVRTRHTWNILREGTRSEAVREYAATLSRTYRAIANATGSHTLVDSGKLPSEAALLPHVEGVTPYYLYLVRDPRAAAHSWTKTKQYVVPMSTFRSTSYWLGFNLASEAVIRRYPVRSFFLRYEDFIAHPDSVVDGLFGLLGAEGVVNPVKGRTVHLGGNHTVTGNPDRFRAGTTLLRPEDDAWKKELPSRARALTEALSWPLMARYGYFQPPRTQARASVGSVTANNDTREDVRGTGTGR